MCRICSEWETCLFSSLCCRMGVLGLARAPVAGRPGVASTAAETAGAVEHGTFFPRHSGVVTDPRLRCTAATQESAQNLRGGRGWAPGARASAVEIGRPANLCAAKRHARHAVPLRPFWERKKRTRRRAQPIAPTPAARLGTAEHRHPSPNRRFLPVGYPLRELHRGTGEPRRYRQARAWCGKHERSEAFRLGAPAPRSTCRAVLTPKTSWSISTSGVPTPGAMPSLSAFSTLEQIQRLGLVAVTRTPAPAR